MVTIIVPTKRIDEYTKRCLAYIRHLDYEPFEVIVVTDKEFPGFPSDKRNFAIQKAQGDIVAFIDSDAYPRADWLNNAVGIIEMGAVGACGPGLLPVDAPLREKAADLVFKCLPFGYRVAKRKTRSVTDFPTFNLVLRKDAVKRVGGFQHYLTGEDTTLCQEISKFGEIVYHPEVVVYHSRRPLFRAYFKQISIWAWHRGHLISLAFLGWLGTWIVYPFNFAKGFLKKK